MTEERKPETAAPVGIRAAGGADRASLMERHVAARARRDAAALGSDEYRAAAEEIARIEVAIALLEEPPIKRGPQ